MGIGSGLLKAMHSRLRSEMRLGLEIRLRLDSLTEIGLDLLTDSCLGLRSEIPMDSR